ncbi:uncharacterized protein LOC113291342 [Papaver somniferum]|uniref:uncharacterized protein LOC113291342 n=1 Tax=Papaver somniferum TaxID=3469 RepID=UPI000E705AD1|nr:uncharacterized protein LOC113291342 [Papaver somniferum]
MDASSFNCPYAKSVWMLPPSTGLNLNLTSDIPFPGLYINWIAGNFTNNVIEVVTTKCWLIWKELCMNVFQDKSISSFQLSLDVLRHLKFWYSSSLNTTPSDAGLSLTNSLVTSYVNNIVRISTNNSTWLPPSLNQFKLNFDASWIDTNENAGYGLIFRSSAGITIQAGSGTINAAIPEEAEALALLEAAKWEIIMNCKYFWIEGDCKGVIDFAQGHNSTIHWRNKAIVIEVQIIIQTCEQFLGFIFSHRNSNNVADDLAKEARKQATTNNNGD